MKIIYHKDPPNIKAIEKAFDLGERKILFTYGDTVYIPSGVPISPDLRTHEATHVQQQSQTTPDEWWAKYLVDAQFRLDQELPAYRNQWRHIQRMHLPWQQQEQLLAHISDSLASPMYGNLLTKEEARKLITGGKR